MTRRLAGAAAIVVAISAMLAAPAAAQPSVSLATGTVTPGHTVAVSGHGWESGALVTLEVCGKAGNGGSVDCAVSDQRTATAGDHGDFTVDIAVSVPPAPCPCVVKATGFGTGAATSVPITVVGAPVDDTPAPDAPTEPTLEIVDAHLEGTGPLASWFGGSPERDAVVTLRNPGKQPVSGAELHVTVGKGEQPSRVVPSPPIGVVQPESTTLVRFTVSLGSLWIGDATVRVEVVGLAQTPTASATTSSHPWGLAVAALVLVQLVLLKVRNRVRRRLAVDVEDGESAMPAVVPTTPVTVPVALEVVEPIDLESAITALDVAIEAIAAVRDQLATRVGSGEHAVADGESFVMSVSDGLTPPSTGSRGAQVRGTPRRS